MKFILGYISESERLVQFASKQIADDLSEEWVEVEADTIEEAKQNYEKAFQAWKQNQVI